MADTYNNYIGRGWTRHDAFADILRRNPPREEYRPGDIVVLLVRFGYHGNTYCYMSKDDVYKPGDLVTVSVRGEKKVVTVDSVGYYSREEFPFEGVNINTVLGPANGNLAEKYREAIEEEQRRDLEMEQIRAEAKEALEEARRMQAEAREAVKAAEAEKEKAMAEREAAYALKTEADRQIAQVQSIRDEAKRAKEEIVAANRRLIDRAIGELNTKMDKVRDKAAKMAGEAPGESIALSFRESDLLRKLDTVYIPETLAMIDRYRKMFAEYGPVEDAMQSGEMEKLRTDALSAIDKSKEVYDNILVSLFARDMMELHAEVEALQGMFAMAGLTDSDFKDSE